MPSFSFISPVVVSSAIPSPSSHRLIIPSSSRRPRFIVPAVLVLFSVSSVVLFLIRRLVLPPRSLDTTGRGGFLFDGGRGQASRERTDMGGGEAWRA